MQDVFLSVSRMDYVFFVTVFAEEFVGFSHGLKFDSVTMRMPRIPRTCQYNGYAKDQCLSHVQAEYVRSLEAQGVRSLCFLLTVGNLLCGVRYQVLKSSCADAANSSCKCNNVSSQSSSAIFEEKAAITMDGLNL